MKNKIKGFLCFLILFTGCSKKINLQLKEGLVVKEYGDEISLSIQDLLIEETDKEVLENAVLQFDIVEKPAVGEHKGSISYEKEMVEFVVSVVDTTAPTFKEFKDEIKIKQNEKDVDFTKYYECEDLSTCEIKVNAETVDLTKEGNYEITVTTSDPYENTLEEKATVIVEKKEETKKENQSQTETKPTTQTDSSSTTTNNSTTEPVVCNMNDASTSGRKYADCWYTKAGHTHVESNGISQVLATARNHIGQTDWNCNDFVLKMFELNNYDCYNIQYQVWYRNADSGQDALFQTLQPGDLIYFPNHVSLVVSASGNSITVIEGGVNEVNSVMENTFEVKTEEDGRIMRMDAYIEITNLKRMGYHFGLIEE